MMKKYFQGIKDMALNPGFDVEHEALNVSVSYIFFKHYRKHRVVIPYSMLLANLYTTVIAKAFIGK